MNQDLEYKRQLRETRREEAQKKAGATLKKYSTGKNKGQAKKTINEAKNLVKSAATPWGVLSLIMQASPFKDWMYGLALFVAIFKDVLDLIEATGIGYVVVVVSTFCASIFIGLMMYLGNSSSGRSRAQNKVLKSYLVLIGGTAIELIFGIDILPIETLTVLIIYGMALAARKQAKKGSDSQSSSSQDEIPTDGSADDYEEDEYQEAA